MFLRGAKEYWGLNFDYIGGMFNESNRADPVYVKTLRSKLDAAGFTDVKITLADFTESNLAGFVDQLENDPELASAVYAFGTHYLHWSNPDIIRAVGDQTKPLGIKMWAGEDNAGAYILPKNDYFGFSRYNAHMYNSNYVEYGLTMTDYCFITYSWLPTMDKTYINTGKINAANPWSGYYEVSPTLWATAHTTQFAEPGWQYLSIESGGSGYLPGRSSANHGGTYVTLVDGNGDWSMIIEAQGMAAAQTLEFRLENGLNPVSNVFVSSGNNVDNWFIEKGLNYLDNESGTTFTLTVNPNEIITVTSTDRGHKGSAGTVIPPAEFFPDEYTEDFESYALHATPKYISDLFGAFEVVQDTAPYGKVIEQQITEPLLPWAQNDNGRYPLTVIGDYNMSECSLTVDAKMPDSGTINAGFADKGEFVEIGGYDADVWVISPGPGFRVNKDGTWNLRSHTGSVWASGKIEGFDGSKWHTYRIDVTVEGTSVFVDNEAIGTVSGTRPVTAMYIGSGWNKTRFDNLSLSTSPGELPGPPDISAIDIHEKTVAINKAKTAGTVAPLLITLKEETGEPIPADIIKDVKFFDKKGVELTQFSAVVNSSGQSIEIKTDFGASTGSTSNVTVKFLTAAEALKPAADQVWIEAENTIKLKVTEEYPKITIESVNELNVYYNDPLSLTTELTVTAGDGSKVTITEIAFDGKDSGVISIGSDGKTITALKKGNQKLLVTVSIDGYHMANKKGEPEAYKIKVIDKK
jgi:galactosylceramidase